MMTDLAGPRAGTGMAVMGTGIRYLRHWNRRLQGPPELVGHRPMQGISGGFAGSSVL